MLPRGLRQPQQHVPSVVREGVLEGQERGCLRGVLRGPLLADRALRHGVRGRTAVLQLGGHQPEGAAGQGAHRRRRHQLHAGVCAAKSADVQRLSRVSCLPALLSTDEQTAPIFQGDLFQRHPPLCDYYGKSYIDHDNFTEPVTRQQCWDGCAALADHDPPCDHYAAYYKELDKTYSCLYFNGCKTDVFTFDFRLGDQFTYWSWPESTTPEIPVGSEVETPEAVKKSKKKSKKKPKKVRPESRASGSRHCRKEQSSGSRAGTATGTLC